MSHCQCQNPPGGGVQCNSRQLAVCRIIGGKCVSQCIDVPSAVMGVIRHQGFNQPEVLTWLHEAMDVRLKAGFLFGPGTMRLNKDGTGYFRNVGRPDVVRFSLPSTIALAEEDAGAGAGVDA